MDSVVYWNQEQETLPRDKLQALQLDRFRERMHYVYERSPMYRRKYDEAGIRPEDIRGLQDISNVPFTTKEDLRTSQAEHPPWGDFLCIPVEEVVRVFQTSGTTGFPVRVGLNGPDWFEHYFSQFMHFIHGYGIKRSDVMYVPFNYGLFVAWWGFQAALEQAGVMIVPGGGQKSEHRVRNLIDWGATVVCGTPSYILFLAETARKIGIPLADSPVRIVVTAGEPGAAVPSTKRAIEEAWGARCYDDLGSTEAANFGFECVAQQGTHMIESMFYAEALDPDSLEPVPPGEVGELVISNLCTESMPLLRYRIRDMVRFNLNPCACGRTFLRLEGGVLGRSDDMLHFAGVNIFPSAIENMVREVDAFSLEYMLTVPAQGTGRSLKIQVEPAAGNLAPQRLKEAKSELHDLIRYRNSISPDIEIVEVGSLPRFEGKARRIIREG